MSHFLSYTSKSRSSSPDSKKTYLNTLQDSYSSSLIKLHSTENLKLSDLKNSSYIENRSLSPLKVKIELNKAKLFRFSIIFKLLNPTSKGKIFYRRSINAAVNSKLLQILHPILENLSTLPQGINYREFCFKMEILIKYLTDQEKYFLFSPHLYTKNLQLPNRHRQSSPRCKSALNTRYKY